MTTRPQPRTAVSQIAPQANPTTWCFDANGSLRKSQAVSARGRKTSRIPLSSATVPAHRQHGAVAIEFAAVFIIILVIFYGTVGYFLPFFLSASYQEIAAEALRQTIDNRYYSSYPDLQEGPRGAYLAERRAVAHQAIENSWLREEWRDTCTGYDESYFMISEDHVWKTCVRVNNPAGKLIPSLKIFNLEIPRLPAEIRGEAKIRAVID